MLVILQNDFYFLFENCKENISFCSIGFFPSNRNVKISFIVTMNNLVTLNAFEAKVKAQFPVVQVHYKSPSVIHVHWPTYLFPPE